VRIEQLARHRNRADFNCGVAALDDYLARLAGQDVRRHVAAVYVLVDPASEQIAGYYTLSASSIEFARLPAEAQRRLPRYPMLPVFLIGRLAVDSRYRRQGQGGMLLSDALRRALEFSSQIGAIGVVVDAKDGAARAFYERFGFQPATADPSHLFIPMGTITQIVSGGS
jgi:GNAT superfamily N-acetyltransferase